METKPDERWARLSKDYEEAYRLCLQGSTTKLMQENLFDTRRGDIELQFVFALGNIPLPKAGSMALDVAAGSGCISSCLQRLGFSVTAFDISEAAMLVAKSHFPTVQYVVGDGTKPREFLGRLAYDLIYMREFVPLAHVDEFPAQIRMLCDYFSLLKPGGWIVIGHHRRKSGLRYDAVLEYCRQGGIRTIGPTYMFLNKHLRVPANWRLPTAFLSKLTGAIKMVTRQNWIEYLLLQKPAEDQQEAPAGR